MAITAARARHLAGKGKRSLLAARSAWVEGDGAAPPAQPPASPIPPWPLEGPGPTFPGVISQACTDAQIRTEAYRAWGQRLRTPQIYVHRKQWEWFYIAQALEEAGVVGPGRRGVGFGVGEEPLAAWFAAQGCTVVATDYPGGEHADAWASSGELATSLSQLNGDGICPDDAFAERVTFRRVDMRDVPTDLDGFDFSWSSCAFEHLGSIENGLQFVREQLRTLRPGGVAVHTTELNVSSETSTLETGPTVLFRRRDIERLAADLIAAGHQITCTFHTGDYPNDRWVDAPPYTNTHLKMRMGEHVTTSFGVLVRRGA